MFLNSIYSRRSVCGIDFTGHDLPRFVKASISKGRIVCEAVDALPHNVDTVCALPPRISLIRRLESPFASAGKTRRVLPSLLDIQMPFSLEECAVVFTKIRPSGDGKGTAVACAARRKDLQQFIADACSRGFDPVYVDIEGVAIWEESMRNLPPASSESFIAVLKVEKEGSLVVTGTGCGITSAQYISSLDSPQLKRVLVAAFGRPTAVEWRICGAKASDPAVADSIEGVGSEWCGSVLTHRDPANFLASALAVRAVKGGEDMINLRSGDDAHPLVGILTAARVRAMAVVWLVSGISLIAASMGLGMLMESRIKESDMRFTETATRLAGGNLGGARGFDAAYRAEAAVEKGLKQAQPLLAPFLVSPAELLGRIASKAFELKLLIELLSISDGSILIEGTAGSWQAPEPLRSFVSGMGYSVELDRQESLADESVRFRISTKGAAGK